MDRHDAAVSAIAATVRGFHARRQPYRIAHGSTNSTRPRQRAAAVVDISALSHVLAVDPERRVARVEPNVPMDRLVEATLAQGLVPPVVMEFPGITAGGGYAGTAGESSSFRHGFFDDTVEAVEMVLADGEVVRASRTERPDLFRGAAGALGTLGVTTLVELRLVEAKKFVKTTYLRAETVDSAIERVRAETRVSENDYVDGILFSKDHGVVITGRLTDEKPADVPAQTFSGAWDPWFFMHVQDRTSSAPSSSSADETPPTDYVPLAEYLFRYDRAGFWVGAAAFAYFRLVPCTRFFRWLLDALMHTRMMYRALHSSGESARFVVQDLVLPYRSAASFVDYTSREFDIWPLWLCPLRQPQTPTFHPHTDPDPSAPGPLDDDALNIGLWGWGPADHDAFVAQNRGLEARLADLGGRKWLYAHAYYPEDEFWERYDRAWYAELRERYGAAGVLPSVWDKVRVDVEARRAERAQWRAATKATWPLGGVYGVWKSILSGDYWVNRRAEWKYKGD